MGKSLKILISLVLQALLGYFFALYVIHLFEPPEQFNGLVAAVCNTFGVWSMGYFLERINDHLKGIHIVARFFAAAFGAFIGLIVVFIFGSTHWLEIPLIPLLGALMGYHFIFFIKAPS